MKKLPLLSRCLVLLVMAGCTSKNLTRYLPAPAGDSFTGTTFFQQARSYGWQQRDSLAIAWFMQGAIPNWWKHFKKISVKEKDSTGRWHKLSYWVSPDYLVLGTQKDWVRVPVTPMAAQQMMEIADARFATRKMVNQIYEAATVKLPPISMVAFRDSSYSMYLHHLAIEGQRQGKKGLIAGIKKDIVTTHKLKTDPRGNRVAIYGWHQMNGQPIQPLYTGHVNWYVDYSHGIRFVYRQMRLNGKKISIENLLENPSFSRLICDEDSCGYFRYPAQ